MLKAIRILSKQNCLKYCFTTVGLILPIFKITDKHFENSRKKFVVERARSKFMTADKFKIRSSTDVSMEIFRKFLV